MSVMDPDAVKRKLLEAKAAEEQAGIERKKIIAERIAARKKLEKEIKDELEKWEPLFPKEIEIIDEKPFVDSKRHALSLTLMKKKGSSKTYVLSRSGSTIRAIQDVDYFIDTFAASDYALEKLKERIPEFIQYLSNNLNIEEA